MFRMGLKDPNIRVGIRKLILGSTYLDGTQAVSGKSG